MLTKSSATATSRKTDSSSESATRKRPRGFAAMDPAQQRRIAGEGGRASHQSGRGHRLTSEEARAAGRKGGQASRGRSTQTNSGS